MEISCHPFGAWNFEVTPRFLGNLGNRGISHYKPIYTGCNFVFKFQKLVLRMYLNFENWS
jgi:hypothetical protein